MTDNQKKALQWKVFQNLPQVNSIISPVEWLIENYDTLDLKTVEDEFNAYRQQLLDDEEIRLQEQLTKVAQAKNELNQ